MHADAEQHRVRVRQAAQGLPLDTQEQRLAGIRRGDRRIVCLAPFSARLEQGRVVQHRPVQARGDVAGPARGA